MLSQYLVKHVLLYQNDSTEWAKREDKFTKAFWLFVQSHENLSGRKESERFNVPHNEAISTHYLILDKYFKKIKQSAGLILRRENPTKSRQDLIKASERFLPVMDDIVKMYEIESRKRAEHLEAVEITIWLITMVVLLLEAYFIFRPLRNYVLKATKALEEKNAALQKSEQRLNQYNLRLESKNREMQANYDEIAAQNEEIQALTDVLNHQVEEQSSMLALQNEKFIEYAFLNAHKVRAPLANILGLVKLMQMEGDKADPEYLDMLLHAAEELDRVVHEMNEVLAVAQFYDQVQKQITDASIQRDESR